MHVTDEWSLRAANADMLSNALVVMYQGPQE